MSRVTCSQEALDSNIFDAISPFNLVSRFTPGAEGEVGRELPVALYSEFSGFPGGAVVENLPANAGDTGSSPGLGRSRKLRSMAKITPNLVSNSFWKSCLKLPRKKYILNNK